MSENSSIKRFWEENLSTNKFLNVLGQECELGLIPSSCLIVVLRPGTLFSDLT